MAYKRKVSYVRRSEVKRSKEKDPELSLLDVMCPICLSIEVEPVTLPCKHEFCMSCFTDSVFKNNKECPLCRLRISSWARRAAKNDGLVNKTRWNAIQRLFPDEVERRLRGDDTAADCAVITVKVPISHPGEIRKEYEEQMRQLAIERDQEDKAGEVLARKIAEEEQRALEELKKRERADELLARELEIISCQTEVVGEKLPAEWDSPCCTKIKQEAKDESSDIGGKDESDVCLESSRSRPVCVAPKTPATTEALVSPARAPDCANDLPCLGNASGACTSQMPRSIKYEPQESTEEQKSACGVVMTVQEEHKSSDPHPEELKHRETREEMDAAEARRRQLEEDFRLAVKIQNQLRKEEREKEFANKQYPLRSRRTLLSCGTIPQTSSP